MHDEKNLLFLHKNTASPLGDSFMPNLESEVGQFWPFPYLAFFSSYRTRFGLAAARGRGPTVRALPGVKTALPGVKTHLFHPDCLALSLLIVTGGKLKNRADRGQSVSSQSHHHY